VFGAVYICHLLVAHLLLDVHVLFPLESTRQNRMGKPVSDTWQVQAGYKKFK
jgi:hypothetical protein